jgi:hypothetical protein
MSSCDAPVACLRKKEKYLIFRLYRHMFHRYSLEANSWGEVVNRVEQKILDMKLWAVRLSKPINKHTASLFDKWQEFNYWPSDNNIALMDKACWGHTRKLACLLIRIEAKNYRMAIVANKITRQHSNHRTDLEANF